jgi:hypothetical protein
MLGTIIMPATTDYLATLKIQLDAAAANKKLALDAAYERATNVVFDKDGKMSTRKTPAGNEAGPGTLDVQYAEQQRNIGTSNEASGTLKSGQYARDLATSQSGYRSTLAGINADRISGQSAIDTDAAAEFAKYKAMYGGSNEPTTGGGTTPAATGGSSSGSGGGGGSDSASDTTAAASTTSSATTEAAAEEIAAPVFVDPNAIDPNKRVTSNIPSNNFDTENLLQLNRPTSTVPAKPQNNQVTSNKPSTVKPVPAATGKAISAANTRAAQRVASPVIKKPVVTPPKKLVPVPKRIGGY